MKKLLFSIVSLMLSASAFGELSFDDAYWIVKNGKLTDNVEVWDYDPEDLEEKIPNVLKDTIVDGENLVVYKQISQHFLDVRLKFNANNPLDLSTNYVMMLEYMIPSSHKGTMISDGNKPLWIFGFASNEYNLDTKNATHAETYSVIDAKWGVADEWVTTYKYIYSKSALCDSALYGMNFSYAREYKPGKDYYKGELTEFPYIKNMAFVSIKEGKPFYAENFDSYDLGEFYEENFKGLKKKSLYNGDIRPVITTDCRRDLMLFRDFLPDSVADQDGSGYIDCELLHALQVESDRDSIVFPGIAIPTGTEKIYSKMLIKKHKNERGLWKDTTDFAEYDLPILLKFNTGEIVDLTNDTIKPIWTKYEGEVKVPAGAESFDLIFKGNGKAGYLVDDIMLSSKKFADVKVDQFVADAFDIVAYVDENGDIVVLNGELVAAYNMEGRVATKNDKIVAIVVKNDKGQLASKIILRK